MSVSEVEKVNVREREGWGRKREIEKILWRMTVTSEVMLVRRMAFFMQAFRKLDETAGKLTDQLRKAAKQVKLDHSWYTV